MNSERSGDLVAVATEFLQMVATGQVREAYQRHVGRGFRHHNPFFRGDAESLMIAMEENAINNPAKRLDIHLTMQEGALVTVLSHVRHVPGELGAALVHIFRFEDRRIVELWDVGQPIPEDSPNEHGMF